jgi:hypothetical protein
VTGWLLVVGAVAFAVAATVLSSTFDWPDILREPPEVVLSLIGFLRWVFVVPPLADAYAGGDPGTKAAVAAAWLAQHQFGGALLGEHLGQLLAIAWSITVSVLVLRSGMLPRWTGLIASLLYLTSQGDILATAIPGRASPSGTSAACSAAPYGASG